MTSSHVRAYWRETRREARDRARERGICTICLTRKARAGKVTCQECSDAATQRTAERRANQR